MAAFNAAATITEQLAALAHQVGAGNDWEVIVVDNGSDDKTMQFVAASIETFPVKLRVVSATERRGAAYARNYGVAITRAPYVAFCDADDRVTCNWVAEALDALQDCDVVTGTILQYQPPSDHSEPQLFAGGHFNTVIGPAISGGNFAAKTETLRQIGGFDESFTRYGHEDSELSIRIHEQGGRVQWAPKMRLFYRNPRGARTLLRKNFRSGQAEVQQWMRHPDTFDRYWDDSFLLMQVVMWAPYYVGTFIKERRFSPRAALRDGVVRLGRLSGYLYFQRAGLPPARYGDWTRT